jgi:hypothetical protein
MYRSLRRSSNRGAQAGLAIIGAGATERRGRNRPEKAANRAGRLGDPSNGPGKRQPRTQADARGHGQGWPGTSPNGRTACLVEFRANGWVEFHRSSRQPRSTRSSPTSSCRPIFLTLRTAPVRTIYGEKALANAVLLDTLIEQLGLTTIVAVPQQMPAGYILAKVAAVGP